MRPKIAPKSHKPVNPDSLKMDVETLYLDGRGLWKDDPIATTFYFLLLQRMGKFGGKEELMAKKAFSHLRNTGQMNCYSEMAFYAAVVADEDMVDLMAHRADNEMLREEGSRMSVVSYAHMRICNNEEVKWLHKMAWYSYILYNSMTSGKSGRWMRALFMLEAYSRWEHSSWVGRMLTRWWGAMLHVRWPGGFKQMFKEKLGKTHPFALYSE